MDIASLNSATLKNLLSLVEKRDSLTAEITKIDAAISSALNRGDEAPAPVPSGKKRGPKPKAARGSKVRKGKRGGLKDKIVAELQAAGKSGASVKELSEKLGIPRLNVYVWFGTTGKKITKRVGKGVYTLA